MNAVVLLEFCGARMNPAVGAARAMRMGAASSARLLKLLPGHDLRFVRALFIAMVGHAQARIHPADKGRRHEPGRHGMAIGAFGWLARVNHALPGRKLPAVAAFIVVSRHGFSLSAGSVAYCRFGGGDCRGKRAG
jgi:hypothetical protein